MNRRHTIGAAIVAALSLALSSFPAAAQSPMSPEARLKELNITLPPLSKPIGNYVEWTRVGNLLFLSGHGPTLEMRGKGKVGKDLTLDQGRQAAREAGLALLATTRDALGSLDKVKRVVKIFGMVNSAPGFEDQPKVIDGCSDLMADVFGKEAGKGARSAVVMSELPVHNPVEIEMILEVSE